MGTRDRRPCREALAVGLEVRPRGWPLFSHWAWAGAGATGQRNARLVRTAPREAGGPTVCVARGPWGVGDGRVVWAGLVPGKNRLGREGEDERGTAPGRTSAGGLGGEEAAGGGWGQAGLRLGSQLLLGSPAASTRQLRNGDH